jgi:capsid protein
MVQQQVVSCFAIFRKREVSFQPGAEGSQQQGEQTETTMADGSTRLTEGVAPGMHIFGDPGETLDGFSPNVPNPEFFEQARLLLTIIGINLGLPLVMVLMDSRESNFSAWRGAVQMAQAGFRGNQKFLVRRFLRPDYRRLVRRWAAIDPAIRAAGARSGVKLYAHKWAFPAWPYIDPLKDAGADLLRTRNGLISHRRRAAERNLDWEDLTAEIVEDNALLIQRAHEKAEQLNADHPGLNVTWREVSSLPTPDGVTVTVGTGDTPASNQREDGER